MENFKSGLIFILLSCFIASCETKPNFDSSLSVEIFERPNLNDLSLIGFNKKLISYPNYGNKPEGVFLLFKIIKKDSGSKKYTFITRGIDSLYINFYDSNLKLIDEKLVGSHIKSKSSVTVLPYSHFEFTISQTKQPYFLLIKPKNVNYKLSVYPLKIISVASSFVFFNQQQFLHSLYIGSFLVLIILGGFLFAFLRKRIYFHYILALFLSLLMMLINYNYISMFFDQLPKIIINKDIYGVLTVLIMINYLLFAIEFLMVPQSKDEIFRKVSYVLIVSSLALLIIFFVFDIRFFDYRNLVEFFIFGLSLLPIYLLVKSLQNNYKPAWVFLIATSPILIIGMIESLSEIHNLPVQLMHSMYYCATFFEMLILIIGLSFRFRLIQNEKEKAMEDLLYNEISVREKERIRIAQDLHDKLGGMVTAAKINFKIFQKKNFTQEVHYIKGLDILDSTAESIREIAHSYASSTLIKLGLINALKDHFKDSQEPSVFINVIGFETRLDLEKEQALYMIILEAYSNIVKHSNAKEVLILFSEKQGKFKISIEDDGIGISDTIEPGLGLHTIEMRVNKVLKGDLKIIPMDGKGTHLTIEFSK